MLKAGSVSGATASHSHSHSPGPGPTPEPSPGPTTWAQRQFRKWAQARQPRTDTLLLTHRNVYILPTRAGWMFGLTLLVLLVASINYQLNLGYLLTFLLAGSGLVSMHVTHATLRGLTLHLRPVVPAFVGDAVGLDVVLTSPGAARFGIGMKLADAPPSTLTWIDVPALGQTHAHMSFVAAARGRAEAPTLSVETRFPLGLFRAWTVWRPASPYLTYPAPERPALPLPQAVPTPGDGPAPTRITAGNEIEGVRSYRRGDPLRLIAWKKAAKVFDAGGELVSRDTTASVPQALWLDWQSCAALAPEARLSRLTAWALAADRADVAYGLRLPGVEITRGSGDAQRRRCLEALALWH